ncbi:hypothetical protein ILUMI_15231, partial [Ignelater luminosus]
TESHSNELEKLKHILVNKPVLNIFDKNNLTIIQSDASFEGLGASLIQERHPISFASRSLTNTEIKYAQIEKELLGIVFACETFHYFIYGRQVLIQTDHKSLISIFNEDVNKVSARLQRMLLKLLKYNIKLEYVPGKNLVVADILSRAFINTYTPEDEEMQYVIYALINNISISPEKKILFQQTTQNDPILKDIFDIENFVKNCYQCQKFQNSNPKQPLINHPIPNRPWQNLSIDFCEFKGNNCIVLVDAYSNWIEVKPTKTKSIDDVIIFLSDTFTRFGIRDIVFSDNNPFNSLQYKTFADSFNFSIRYPSPHFHQSNGLAEKAVNIVKNILKKSNNIKDLPFLIMKYNNTPLPMLGYSPSQLLLNRVMKTKIPISDEILKPDFIDSIQKQLEFKQDKQKIYFDRNSKILIKLNKGENITIQMGNYWKKGKVKDIVNERSYIVQDEFGKTYHRNRKFLNKTSLEYVPKYDTFLDDDQLLSNDPHTPEQLLQPENKSDSDLLYLNESDLPSLTNLFDDGNEDQQTPNSKVNINSNLPVQSNTNNSRPVREKSAPSYLKDYYLGNA